MDKNHYLLIVFWILYYVLHSVFAASRIKKYFYHKWNFRRYYRLAYTFIVSVLLIGLLLFQYSFQSKLLWNLPILYLPAIIVLILPGIIIMFISIRKYFVLLSGIRSLYQSAEMPELKIDGLHRYMRHPLYTGTILAVWGFFILFPYLNNLLTVVLLTMYVVVGIRFEEKKLIQEFGSAYVEYKEKVPALVPRLYREKLK